MNAFRTCLVNKDIQEIIILMLQQTFILGATNMFFCLCFGNDITNIQVVRICNCFSLQ